MMVADPKAAEHVKLMFEMYVKQGASFGDITRHFAERGIEINGKRLQRATVSYILRNPVYTHADLDVYEFFKSQGTAISNDVADFTGTSGCYLFQGRDVAERKTTHLKNQILVLAPHEGLVSSETWLACRRRLATNLSVGGTRKATNTWLSGKIKCGRCGTGISLLNTVVNIAYFRCRKRTDSKSCMGCGKIRAREFEQFIYDEMLKK
jgi:hypothetical protein